MVELTDNTSSIKWLLYKKQTQIIPRAYIYYYYKIKFTYVPVLQDIIQGTHDLAASLALFSSADQQYEAHNLGYGSSHGVQGTQSCAILPFQYSNL